MESDSSLRGVVLDLDAFPGTGFATLERLGAALADLRAAGKTVVTHSEGLSQGLITLRASATSSTSIPKARSGCGALLASRCILGRRSTG